eukprot:403339047
MSNGFQTLKQTSQPAFVNSQSHKFTYNTKMGHSMKDNYYYMQNDRPHASLNLQRHEIFPGYTHSKPLSLQKSANIERSIEGCTQTSKRHFLNLSVQQIDEWLQQKNYLAVTKLVIEGFLDILKQKMRKYSKELHTSDEIVLLENCAIKGLISYPDFISLSNILQSFESATQKRIEPSEQIPYSSHTYGYLPNNHMGTYDFSNPSSFKNCVTNLDSNNAKEALRILVDFIKNEVDQSNQNKYEKSIRNTGRGLSGNDASLKFEPFLTHLIELRDRFLD